MHAKSQLNPERNLHTLNFVYKVRIVTNEMMKDIHMNLFADVTAQIKILGFFATCSTIIPSISLSLYLFAKNEESAIIDNSTKTAVQR